MLCSATCVKTQTHKLYNTQTLKKAPAVESCCFLIIHISQYVTEQLMLFYCDNKKGTMTEPYCKLILLLFVFADCFLHLFPLKSTNLSTEL